MDSVLITTWDDSLNLEPATRAMLNEGADVQVRALPWKVALQEPPSRRTRVVFALEATAEGLEGVVHAAAEVSSDKRLTVDGWLFVDPSDPSFASAFAKGCASERPHWVVQASDEDQWQQWAREALRQLFSTPEASETGPAAAPAIPPARVPFPGEVHRTELESEKAPAPSSTLPSPALVHPAGSGAASAAEGRVGFPGPAASAQGPRYTYVFDSDEILAMRGEPKVEGPQVASDRSNRTVILPSVDLSPSRGPLKRNLAIAAAVAVAAVIAFFVVG